MGYRSASRSRSRSPAAGRHRNGGRDKDQRDGHHVGDRGRSGAQQHGDRDRGRDRDRDREREREGQRDRPRHSARDDRGRGEDDRGSSRDRERDRERERERGREREQDRDGGRSRGRDRGRYEAGDRQAREPQRDRDHVNGNHTGPGGHAPPPPPPLSSSGRAGSKEGYEEHWGDGGGTQARQRGGRSPRTAGPLPPPPPMPPPPQGEEPLPLQDGEEGPAPPARPKEEPNLGLSGKLAAETNKVNGVVLKHQPPPEARKPAVKWRLYVFKNDKLQDEPYYVHRMDHYLFGRDNTIADIITAHPSISKQHAVLQFRLTEKVDPATGMPDARVRPYLLDLGSVNGTFLNGERIEGLRYYELLEKDVFKFGMSSREYVMLHDKSTGDGDGE